jgi:SLOG cluster2/TIR domain
MPQPPLRIHVLHHPASESGFALARAMLTRFSGSPHVPGMRIPLRFVPDTGSGLPPELDAAELDCATHTVVAVIADERMAQLVRGGTGKAWGRFLAQQLEQHPLGKGPHCVLPIALDASAFGLSPDLDKRSFVRLDVLPKDRREDELFFHIAVRALQLLRGSSPSMPTVQPPAPIVELFVSHAKRDLPPDPDNLPAGKQRGPVYELLAYLARGPVKAWYDAKDIPPGGRFDDAIHQGVIRSSVLVAVVTDEYASREWCRREVLQAKRAGLPIVVVDALEKGEARSFPYLGNVPTIRWRSPKKSEMPMPRAVTTLALHEALRYVFTWHSLMSRAEPDDLVLGTAPELLTISSLPNGKRYVIYPDPPLGREETEILREVMDAVALVTPLSRVVGRLAQEPAAFIGLSLSTATDVRRYGVSQQHIGLVADDLAILLLLAGARLGYGGRIGPGSDEADEDYTTRLFTYVRSFHPLARDVFLQRFHPIVNYVGWPLHRSYGPEQMKLYGQEADLIEVDPPHPLGVPEAMLHPDKRGFLPPHLKDAPDLGEAVWAARRFAWGRGMTEMRRRMTKDITARICLGGNLEEFVGQCPGVLEEGLLMLEAGKPLFLIGAFGGATRLLVDGLLGKERCEFTTAWAEEVIPHYSQVCDLYQQNNLSCFKPEEIASCLRTFGARGLQEALRNGLDDAQNLELFTCTDPFRIVELVLEGLVGLS